MQTADKLCEFEGDLGACQVRLLVLLCMPASQAAQPEMNCNETVSCQHCSRQRWQMSDLEWGLEDCIARI